MHAHMSMSKLKLPRNLVPVLLFHTLVMAGCRHNNPAPDLEVSQTTYADTTFWQEYHQAFPLGNDPSMNEVRSIAVDHQGDVWIATAAGIYKKEKDSSFWTPVLEDSDQGPSFSVAVDGESLWMSTWNGVYRSNNNEVQKMEGVKSPISSLCTSKEGIYALGPYGVWHYTEKGFMQKPFPIARSIRNAVSDGAGGLWVASDVGLYHCTEDTVRHFLREDELISAYIHGVSLNNDEVWAVGLGGVTVIKNDAKVSTLSTADGMPSINVNCVRRSPDGTMWVGTDVGVVRYSADHTHSLRFSRRWLMDDNVNDISFDGEGNAWIATARGVSVIRRKKMTLASKQSYFYDVLMRRHIRDPWIAGQCRLATAGDTTRWEPEDDDNDGEYTGNYLAMESFRYAATGDKDARDKARKAFHFLKMLADVTGSDGFFARTIVPADWTFVHDVNRTYTDRQLADELVKEPRFKPVTIRWRKSSDGKWMWKGDTSSDEICGHMFGYFMYYELAADETEKEVVRKHVSRIVDHLMAHNFTLTDIDGKPTRWGIWSPDKLNRDPEWSPDRSLNSMEILSFLKLAYYVTGREKYQESYLHLIHDEGYLDNMSNIPNQNPAWFIYFDVILAAYQYPILLKCEKDPELLKFYSAHIDKWFEMRKGDENPLINFIYSFARNRPVEIKSSVAFMQDTPLDLIDWPIDHGKREDVKLVHNPVLGEVQMEKLQPASIRATVRWDKNPWGLQGGDPAMEREPVFWLLPYWMGRYLEMIE